MTQNPYAPPSARVEEPPEPSAASGRGRRFWGRFYLSPVGRTGRLFYWLFGFIPLALIGVCFGIFLPRTHDATRYVLIGAILAFWPQVAILARRLHDLNLTGWWVTLFWALPAALVLLDIPLPPGTGSTVQWLAAVILGLIPGTPGPNRYGNDPRGNTGMTGSQTS